MPKEEKITLDAVVKEALPDTRFMVELENGQALVGSGRRFKRPLQKRRQKCDDEGESNPLAVKHVSPVARGCPQTAPDVPASSASTGVSSIHAIDTRIDAGPPPTIQAVHG